MTPIEVSCRVAPVAGGLRPARAVRRSTVGLREVTVLIHGFNNSYRRARATWKVTMRRIRGLPAADRRRILTYFWPGDRGHTRWTSAALYADSLPFAVDAGRLLADYLRAAGIRRARLVAHSLGSRVALTAATALAGDPNVTVTEVVLLAAAVPEGLCEQSRAYSVRPRLRRDSVMFSRADRALGRVFELGQWAARLRGLDIDPGPNRTAVGRSGRPVRRWHGDKYACGLSHGEYWTERPARDRIAAVVAGRQFRQVRVRPVPRHGRPSYRTVTWQPASR